MGFEHKKSLGQHFLTSDVVPKWMCDAANLQVGEIVLEVGPGTGVLTREILNRGARVIALEADTRALAVLQDTFADEIASGALSLHHSDVRKLDFSTLGVVGGQYKVVANIPYYLSGHLFRSFLETNYQPTTLVFLVQREVAKRITTERTRGEKESILSLSVKAYGTPTYIRTVTKGHFNPPPQIDSAIICITPITKEAFTDIDEAFFFELLHLGFGQKRKQLLGNLSNRFTKEQLLHSFSTLNLDPTVRAEDLDITIWLKLCRALTVHS